MKAESLEKQVVAWEEINPNFIFISPTLISKTSFECIEKYREPLEPIVLPYFNYQMQNKYAKDKAKNFIARSDRFLRQYTNKFDKIFAIMRSGYFRSGTIAKTKFDDNYTDFKAIVSRRIEKNEPLIFTLPSFPFKFANPIKLCGKSADMAEILCLSRLYEICMAIGEIYEPGAKFKIISDGQVYCAMFGVTLYEALQYKKKTEEMIKNLGFRDNLAVVDMKDLVAMKQQEFDEQMRKLREPFKKWWTINKNDHRKLSLIRSSANNINLELGISQDLIKLITTNIIHELNAEDTLTSIKKLRELVYTRSDECAFEFSLFLYSLKEIDLVNKIFRDSIRCTVHPKPRQWGLHLVNSNSRIFPWHGVSVKYKNNRWKIHYEADVIRKGFTPVHIDGDLFPLYYQEKT